MVHESAASGYRDRADAYETARPAYNAALVARFITRYTGQRVLDLGAGTGIFTSQLASAGVAVIAVEPVAEMRAVLASKLPDVAVVAGTAEGIPLDEGSVRTVVSAQAFHWFDHGRALDEIHRVVPPGGFLVTVWNVLDHSVQWVQAYNQILQRYEGSTPRHRDMVWRAAIDGDARFQLVDDWGVDNRRSTTVDGVVDRALSTSFIAALPAAEQDRVANQIRAVVRPHSPRLEFPYRSELQAWRRT